MQTLAERLLIELKAAESTWRKGLHLWQDYRSNIPGDSMRYGSYSFLSLAMVQNRNYSVYIGDGLLSIHWHDAYYDYSNNHRLIRYPWI